LLSGKIRISLEALCCCRGFQNLYGITSIPANLLPDKNGTIIAKNLIGKELETALELLIK
jgi:hypothetical protein